ncbi:putative helicase [Gordonia phage GMA3]|uniref:Putative helicase n=1 Tax=Gordonia phage GMA3 TaxID=1647284 RepID=A0A0K0NKK5_9CAUD|nr:DNA helicase [Gordonia phage GMA3]AKL88235.1 putative helicase [Gordonia phage GMA3]
MALNNRKSIAPYIKDDIEYYKHQIDGIRRGATMQSFLLADEMGLGKSLQSLTIFGIDLYMKRSESMIIVCPTTLKMNWANEIQKFMGDVVQYMILPNKQVATREKQLTAFSQITGPRILIVNYEQVKPHIKTLRAMHFDIMLCDEAHMIKNHKSERTKAAHALAKTCVRKFLLTGSPILNHVNDLWSLGHLIDPAAFGSYYGFINTYAVFGGYENRQIVSTKNVPELNAKLAEIMIRRLKKDVLDLPDVNYVTRTVGLHPKQEKMYKEVVNDLRLNRGNGLEAEDVDNVLTKFMRLKQICGTTATLMDDKSDFSYKLDAAVWDAVNLVRDGERVVVFTQYRGVQDAFVNRLVAEFNLSKNRVAGPWTSGDAKHIPPHPVFVLNGDVPSDERQKVVDAWTRHKIPGVIVCIYSVAGTGLNMTASRYCQRLDKLFAPMLNQQAVDRIHRIGADKKQPVTVLDYLCKDTAEERVDEIVSIKKKISDDIVEEDPLLRKRIAAAVLEERD